MGTSSIMNPIITCSGSTPSQTNLQLLLNVMKDDPFCKTSSRRTFPLISHSDSKNQPKEHLRKLNVVKDLKFSTLTSIILIFLDH